MKNLRLQISTWNVGSTDPDKVENLSRLFPIHGNQPLDFYAISFQEIETGVLETAKSFLSYDDWTKYLMKYFSKNGYYMVENVRVQGITLCVFSLLTHLPFIRFIKTDIERTGELGSVWGDKGGVAISMKLCGLSICFLNTHLQAHLNLNEERLDDFNEVVGEINFGKTMTILEHDLVFWAGDLNFRIDNIERSQVLELINQKKYEPLLKEDQLNKQFRRRCVISEFIEGPIQFPPTYKFDPGTDTYDTSNKQRKPGWTDRILHRVNPDKTFVHDLVEMQLTSQVQPQSYANELVHQVEGSYRSHMYFKESDHKPVTAHYIVKIKESETPLVTLKVGGKWKSQCDEEVTVTYHNGMTPKKKDYLGLYEENFSNFRDYKTFKHMSENKEEEVKAEFSKICKFAPDKVERKTRFRIGYYSDKMSCLLAITEPFPIVEF